jgi:acetyl-CoA C-acetyltransferase
MSNEQRTAPGDAVIVDVVRTGIGRGAIALGHPLDASGARLITSLAHELRRSESPYAIVTLCCRGGPGTATLLERDPE